MDVVIKESEKKQIENLIVLLGKAQMTLSGKEVMIAAQAMGYLATLNDRLNAPNAVTQTSQASEVKHVRKAKKGV